MLPREVRIHTDIDALREADLGSLPKGSQSAPERTCPARDLSFRVVPSEPNPLHRGAKTITEGTYNYHTPLHHAVLQEFGRVRQPVADFHRLARLASSISTVAGITPKGSKHGVFPDFELGKLSSVQVGFAVANLVMGNALLTVPFGFALCGWSAVPMIVLSTALLLYTACLLGDVIEVLDKEMDEPGYCDIAVKAFGDRVAPVLVAFCCGECFFMLVFFFVFVGTSLAHTLSLPVPDVIFAVVPIAFLIKMVPTRYFSMLSILGLFLVLAACAACVYSGIELPEPSTSKSMWGTVSLAGVFSTMGAVAVCVSDHPVFPELYHSSRSKAAFQKGLVIGFMVFLLVALVLGAATYASFGASLHQVALKNIGFDTHHQPVPAVPQWLGPTCNIVLSARCVQVMPNFLGPILELVYGILKRCGLDLSIPYGNAESELSLLKSYPGKCVGRLVIIGSCLLLCGFCSSLFDNLMDLVESLMSSMFKSVNAFVIPCLGYYALCRSQLHGKPLKRFSLLFILSIGVSYGVVGTITSLQSMYAEFTK